MPENNVATIRLSVGKFTYTHGLGWWIGELLNARQRRRGLRLDVLDRETGWYKLCYVDGRQLYNLLKINLNTTAKLHSPDDNNNNIGIGRIRKSKE